MVVVVVVVVVVEGGRCQTNKQAVCISTGVVITCSHTKRSVQILAALFSAICFFNTSVNLFTHSAISLECKHLLTCWQVRLPPTDITKL